MAPGVYKAFVAEVICSALAFGVDMVRFYAFSSYELDSTQSAPIFLSLEQHQPLFRMGFPCYLSLLSLHPVLAQSWVVGSVPSCDFCEAGNGGYVGLDQFCLLFLVKGPVAVILKVSCFYPLTSFVRMSAFCPYPQHLPLGMSDFTEDFLGCAVSVVVRPSADHGVERFDYFHRSGLLMCVQVGAYCPDVFQDFLLLWDGQQCSRFPEFPDGKPQEVKPFCDVHDPGFGFTQLQSSFFEESLNTWSGVGFQ